MSWPLVKLKNCCDVVGGATPKRDIEKYWDSPDIPWVTPKDISNLDSPILSDAPEYISKVGFKSCATYMLPKGSVLVTSRAPIGNIAIAGRDMCTNQGFKSLVPGEKVDGLYLYYCMRMNSAKLQALGNGATFKEVSKKIVEEFEVPLPPLPEQKRIAAILDKADAIRRKRQQAIQLADEFLRSVFLDMFGDPVMNPKGWELKLLSDLCKKITDGTHHSPPITSLGIPYITAKHLKSTGLEFFNDPWYVSEESHKEIYARCAPEKHDVLYIKDGATTGLAAINVYDFEFSMLSSLALLKPNREKILPEYLCMFLNHPRSKLVITANMAGAAITRLTLAKIKEIRVPLPSLSEQQKFSDTYWKVRGVLDKISISSSITAELFKSLSQKAFAGEL